MKSEKCIQHTVKRLKPPEENSINIHSNEAKNDTVTLDEIAKKLRQQVSKWQSVQTDSYLRQLKEHEHFEIKVCQGMLADTSVAVTFTCMICNKKIPISAPKPGTFALSNWTRHVKTCKSQKAKEKMSQSNLHNFLSSVPPLDDKSYSITKIKKQESAQNIENIQNLESQNPCIAQNSQGFHLAPPTEY